MNPPAGNDQMLAFCTGIGVKPVRTSEEDDLSRHIAVQLVLTSRHRCCDEEQDEPRNADLVEHLKIQDANARVQLGANEEVVHGRSSHAVGASSHDRLDIHDDAVDVARKDGDSHDRAEFVNKSVERKHTSYMQAEGYCNCGVEA